MNAADPFAGKFARAAFWASAASGVVGVLAGAVRVLPWVFDAAIPLRLVVPFARGLTVLAVEAAILVGWPLGWALAAFAFVESGESLAVRALGESPARTLARFAPRGLLFATALALASIAGGRDANEPGRIVNELVAEGRVACAHATSPVTYPIPFAGVTWTCAPGTSPRLVGHPPGGPSSAILTATNATLTGDLRRIDLEDARVAFRTTQVHANELTLRGLPPWTRASSLPAFVRAAILVASAAIAAWLASFLVLGAPADHAASSSSRRRLRAIVLAVAGPLAALASLRVLERSVESLPWFLLVPFAATVAPLVVALVFRGIPTARRGDAIAP